MCNFSFFVGKLRKLLLQNIPPSQIDTPVYTAPPTASPQQKSSTKSSPSLLQSHNIDDDNENETEVDEDAPVILSQEVSDDLQDQHSDPPKRKRKAKRKVSSHVCSLSLVVTSYRFTIVRVAPSLTKNPTRNEKRRTNIVVIRAKRKAKKS